MSFPRYPAYRPSGVEWLGEVPEHWEILPVKRLASLQSGTGITSDSISEDATYPVFGGNGVRGFSDSFTHEGYYPIIGRQGALCGNINYATGRFWASEHAVVVSPARHCEVRWLGETLRAMSLNQYSTSAAQPGLSVEMINTLMVPCPPQKEQAAIATFLVRETAKIGALIAEQQRLIELLQEKRQAVISHAVTKGLNPHAPMKDSGVEWLGEVPEHWGVTRLKHVTELMVDCPHETPTYIEDGEFLVIRTADLDRGILLSSSHMRRVDRTEYMNRIRRAPLQICDIVYGREGERWGHAALVPISARFCLGQRMMQFRCGPGWAPAFLMWLLNSRSVYLQGSLDTVGATSPHVNVGTIRNYALPEPPPGEQALIADYLAKQAMHYDSLIDQCQQSSCLLSERRSALISAAVTGQIDVRGLSPEADAA